MQIHGVDWPSFTAVTQITVPENWRGTSGLLGDGQEQGNSLSCFFPVDQEDFRSAPPAITITKPVGGDPVIVNVTDSVSWTDGPESAQSWVEGLWSVTKHTWGYQVNFSPEAANPGHGPMTVILDAPYLNLRYPRTDQLVSDDGHGMLKWTFPSSPQQPPGVTVSLTTPWQVRMNMASDLWPIRWFSDASWTLGDGVVVDIIALWASWRLLRRRHGRPEEQRLPRRLIFLSMLSLAGYIGYVADDYIWHHLNSNYVWLGENLALVAVTAFYFLMSLGMRWYWAAPGVLCSTATAGLCIFPGPPYSPALAVLVIKIVPLLAATAFATVGSVLYISRMWPFGKNKRRGYMRALRDSPFRGGGRLAALLVGALILGALVLGQSAAASYYYWQHSHWWRQGSNARTWVAADLLNDAHWWIGDGIQWPLGFAVVAGIFAVLWAMSGDARGVFLGALTATNLSEPRDGEPADRGDLALLAAIASGLFVGTWGSYDGLSIPLPFIVAFVGLTGWGLTRAVSKLDWKSVIKNREIDTSRPADRSPLVHCRDHLLAASERISAAANGQTAAAAVKIDALPEVIALESVPQRSLWLKLTRRQQPSPELQLPMPVDPGVIALALGPSDTWWENGMTAVRAGKYLVTIPFAFDIYISWNSGSLSLLSFPFGLQDALGMIASTLLGWVSGLFVFGMFVPYLRGIRTPVKGVAFGLIAFAAFASDAGLRYGLGVAPYPTFVMDGLLAVALFAALGVFLDIRTLRSHNDQGLISSIYRLGSVRVGVTYATTLVIVAVSLWQAIYLTGATAQQRAQNISNTAQYVNSVGGTGAPSGHP